MSIPPKSYQEVARIEALEARLLLAAYFVRADGGAADLALAGGPASDPAHCLSLARVNAAAFAPGDTVWFSSAGGAFTGLFSPTASGSPGAPVTYAGLAGEPTGPATVNYASGAPVKVLGLHDVVIEGFSIIANSDSGVFLGTSATNITLRDLVIDAAGSGVFVYDTFNGLTLEDITTSSRIGAYSVYVADLASPGKDLTVRRLTTSAGTVRIRQVTNLTLEDIHLANVTRPGATALQVEEASGTLSLRRGSITSGAGMGLVISGGHFTSALVDQFTVTAASQTSFEVSYSSGITFTHCSALNGMDNGFRVMDGCSFITFEDCLASDNLGDGYDTANFFTHDVVFRRCQALYNGDMNDLAKSSGDGFSCHYDNYNILLDSCLAIGNIVSGVAMVGTSAGIISNCLFLNNGGDWTAQGGQQMLRGGLLFGLVGPNAHTNGSWVVRNTVSAGSYPCEVNVSFVGSSLVDLDYNSYYSSDAALGFACLSDDGTYIPWAAYASREPHSIYAPLAVDEIRGLVWNDLNGDGVRNAREPAIAGRTVFLDANGDGTLDPGEVATLTGADGRFAFAGLPDGLYAVAQVLPAGWVQTLPAGGGSGLAVVGASRARPDVAFAAYVASLPTGAPDLLGAYDSGSSAVDDLTHRDNNGGPSHLLGFLIPDALPNAVVDLYADGVWIGSALAPPAGGSVVVTTLGGHYLSDGPHVITARQAEPNKGPSADSSPLYILVDATPPLVSLSPPASSVPAPALSGAVDDPDAQVTVTVNGQSFLAHNNADGTWTLPEGAILPAWIPGVFDVLVQAVDRAGNVGMTTGPLAGDVNLDGQVGLLDYNIIKANFGQIGSYWQAGDLSGDGQVGLLDYNIVKANFGRTTPPAPLSPARPPMIGPVGPGSASLPPSPAQAWTATADATGALAQRKKIDAAALVLTPALSVVDWSAVASTPLV